MMLEKDLRRCFEPYRVLEYPDLVRQVKRPQPEKKKALPAFNEAAYKKRYANDFTVFFEDEAALKAFLRKKHHHEVKQVREYNRQIEQQNRDSLAEWEREKKAVSALYRRYANQESEGVEWFFTLVIGNIPHDFFLGDDFQCAYDSQHRTLSLSFDFPDTATIFDARDKPTQIQSINDPVFKPFYFGVLILMIRILFTAVDKNDLKKAVDQVHLKGSFSHSMKAKAAAEKDFSFEISSPLDSESLKKIREMRPEDLMKYLKTSTQPPPDPPKPDPSNDNQASVVINEESFRGFKEKLFQALQHLSKLEASIMGTGEQQEPPESSENDEEQEKYSEFIQKVNGLPTPLMRAFEKVLLLNPAEKHPLSSINISKLGSLQLVNRLIFQGIPLIQLTGTNGEAFVWGENYPEDLIHALRRQFLKEGE